MLSYLHLSVGDVPCCGVTFGLEVLVVFGVLGVFVIHGGLGDFRTFCKCDFRDRLTFVSDARLSQRLQKRRLRTVLVSLGDDVDCH